MADRILYSCIQQHTGIAGRVYAIFKRIFKKISPAAPETWLFVCDQYFGSDRTGRFADEFLRQRWRYFQDRVCDAVCSLDQYHRHSIIYSDQKTIHFPPHFHDTQFCAYAFRHHAKDMESAAGKLHRYTANGSLPDDCMAGLDIEFVGGGVDNMADDYTN